MGSHVTQASLGFAAASQAFLILLWLLPTCWDCRHVPCGQLPAGAESIYLCPRWGNRQGSEPSASLALPGAGSEFRQANQEQRNEVMSKADCYEGNTKTQRDGASWGGRGYFTWGGWQRLMGAKCPLNALLRGFKKNRTFPLVQSQESWADGLGLRSHVAWGLEQSDVRGDLA